MGLSILLQAGRTQAFWAMRGVKALPAGEFFVQANHRWLVAGHSGQTHSSRERSAVSFYLPHL